MDFIIYHKDCPDGWCAAYIASKKYPEAELIPASYGTEPVDLEKLRGKDVLIVDFSYKREVMLRYALWTNSLTVYDHHKTAQEELKGLELTTKAKIIFDMNRSGAGITWDELEADMPRPWVVNYVEDRDLWKKKLPCSNEVSAYIMSHPYDSDIWDDLFTQKLINAMDIGNAILRNVNKYVSGTIQHGQPGKFFGYKVKIVNAAYINISDVCNKMLEDGETEVAIGYFERNDQKYQFSLRSKGDLDVSKLAVGFGGGGHKNAAGFELDYKQGRVFVDSILGRE